MLCRVSQRGKEKASRGFEKVLSTQPGGPDLRVFMHHQNMINSLSDKRLCQT